MAKQRGILFRTALILPPDEALSPQARRTIARLAAVGGELAKLKPPPLDESDLNDALRVFQDLLLLVKRAKAAAHNRPAEEDKEVGGDGG